MFANIKNGQMAKKSFILQTRKKVCESFLKILWDEGFISGYKISSSNIQLLEILLKYKQNGQPVISTLKLVSKPGHRVYYSAKQIWKIDSTKAFIILSTNRGLKSLTQCKKLKIGGEPVLVIN
jgi:small subunit ribosomal protein S8